METVRQAGGAGIRSETDPRHRGFGRAWCGHGRRWWRRHRVPQQVALAPVLSPSPNLAYFHFLKKLNLVYIFGRERKCGDGNRTFAGCCRVGVKER